MATEDRELVKMTVRYFSEDLEYLRLAYPHTGYNTVLRALAARHVRKLKHHTVEHLGDKTELLTREELEQV